MHNSCYFIFKVNVCNFRFNLIVDTTIYASNLIFFGPQSKLIKIENPEDLKVVVDLSGKKAGKYQKKYQVRGIDSGINYQINNYFQIFRVFNFD
jgi:YbbR domain-containing protein